MKIDHIAIAVVNLDAAIEHYRLIGFEVTGLETVMTERVRVAFLELGDDRVELIEPLAGSTVERFVERRGPGIHHIALGVEDLDAELTRLQEAGIELIDEQPGPGAEGSRVVFVHPREMGGVLIELVER
ncbi:MAG: methylmalonyl-CoA epimerase [Candidatus Bipolaricaulia bacterium]